MKTVVLESPFKGATPEEQCENIAYARACLKDCLDRGEAPFASHLLYTQVLDDNSIEQRTKGIASGLALAKRLDKTVVYTDRGISMGMKYGIEVAVAAGRPIEYRSLDLDTWKPVGG